MGKTDYVQIQFSVDNAKEIENMEPPDFPDFTIVQGPSQSTGMSIVNGAMSQSKSVSYVLQPKYPGKFTIRGATATVDGKLMHSNPVTINVRNVGSYGTPSPQPSNSGANLLPNNFNLLPDAGWPDAEPQVNMEDVIKPGENVAEKIKKNLFIKVELSKKDCYVGEPIMVTYKLYSRLRSESRVTKFPSLNGFSVYDMTDPGKDQSSVEKINGKNFTVHIIRKAQLIPLQSGDVSLDPVSVDNNVYFMKLDAAQPSGSGQGLGSLFDRLFNQGPQGTPFTQHLVLNSKPIVVHVKPLPEAEKPADFNGAVGRYSIQASVDSREIDTGDAAILTVKVKGTGNLPMVNAPVVDWPANMGSYDVSSKEDIDKAHAPLGGSKTFSYSFTCSKTGKYTVPPVKFNYFDPVADSYKTVQTDSIPLWINHASSQKPSASPLVKAPATVLVAGGWLKNILWIIGGILIGALGIYFLMQKRQVRPTPASAKTESVADPVKPAEEPAPVTDPLRESKELIGTGDYGKFYAAVNRAVWKGVSDKLQLPGSQLNKSNITTALRSLGWKDGDVLQLSNLLNECEMKLYTPEYSSADVARTLEEAERVMGKLVDG